MIHNITLLNLNNVIFYGYSAIKKFFKERYNTYAKTCYSNLYKKYHSATYIGLLLGTIYCL